MILEIYRISLIEFNTERSNCFKIIDSRGKKAVLQMAQQLREEKMECYVTEKEVLEKPSF